MKLVKSKVRYTTYGHHNPHTVILHHTAGGRIGSESYLQQKGLGYHYMIDREGIVYSYNPVTDVVGHASKANHGYVGVAYVSGGPLGPTSEAQIQASIELLSTLAEENDSIVKVSNHATIDKIVAKRGWKSDPQYVGEKVEQNDFKIKNKELDRVAKETGLQAIKYNIIMSRLPIFDNVFPRTIETDGIEVGD